MFYNCTKFQNNPRGSVEKHPQICWIDMEWPMSGLTRGHSRRRSCSQHSLLPQPVRSKFVDPGDELVLEDDLQRITLVGGIDVQKMVTGRRSCDGRDVVIQLSLTNRIHVDCSSHRQFGCCHSYCDRSKSQHIIVLIFQFIILLTYVRRFLTDLFNFFVTIMFQGFKLY